MKQTFKTEGEIKATLTPINRRGKRTADWIIENETDACDSCLICNYYKYNHDNIRLLKSTFVHICLLKAPNFIDITKQLITGLNTSCQYFSRRALG